MQQKVHWYLACRALVMRWLRLTVLVVAGAVAVLAVVLATVAVGVYTAAVWWLCHPLLRGMVRRRATAEARK